MWGRCPHKLAHLTKRTFSQIHFKQTKIEQDIFDKIKSFVARNTLLTYLYLNEEFKNHTNSSDSQLVSVTNQGKLITVYSRNITETQRRCTVTEREILSIFETLKEFRTILLGQIIRICTVHKKLTCESFNSDRVLLWTLILKQQDPEI